MTDDRLDAIREQIAALPSVSGLAPDQLDCRPIAQLVQSFKNFGFQASNLAAAVDIINQMVAVRNGPVDADQLKTDHPHFYEMVPANHFKPLTIILAYTSNMVSCGNREVIRFLAQHNLVDCIVTTAGGIEEDFVKCIAPTKFMDDGAIDDAVLRQLFMNRINNLLVPSDNYTSFEDWVMPLFKEMHDDQLKNKTVYSPSRLIHYLGSRINNSDSIYHWTSRNNIPVFCPALTDGAIGDMLYFYSIKHKNDAVHNFVLDTLSDLVHLNNLAKFSVKRGIIVLGGGVVKHHTCNACLMANGADYAVFVNTGIEYDGSDSGAPPSEAVSWGKIKSTAPSVKVFGDASILFPLIVCASDLKNKITK